MFQNRTIQRAAVAPPVSAMPDAPVRDLTQLSASEMARLVAVGDISAAELVAAHIDRIEAVNPTLNAVVVKRYDDALAEAAEVDRRRRQGETLPPLAGVPVTIKESLDLQGLPSTVGIPARVGQAALSDAPAGAPPRPPGAISNAQTNMGEALVLTPTH